MEKAIRYFDYVVTVPAGYDEEREEWIYEERQGVVAGFNHAEALAQIAEFYGFADEPESCVSIEMTYHSVLGREVEPCGCECECEG